MNDIVQLEELRKAQRELNDAFSFRRSINVDAESEAFSVQAGSAQQNTMMYENNNVSNMQMNADGSATMAATTASATATPSTTTTTTTKRKVRRRVLKRPSVPTEPIATDLNPMLPDLEMPYGLPTLPDSMTDINTKNEIMSPEEMAEIDREFDKYTLDDNSNKNNKYPMSTSTITTSTDPLEQKTNQNRFQQQLSGNWNEQILQNQDILQPMAMIMNQIAILEQEKKASIQRLEEEYQQRQQIENEYYQKQRQLLQDNINQIQQQQSFGGSTSSLSSSSSSTTTTTTSTK
jgi:hypothetical protein